MNIVVNARAIWLYCYEVHTHIITMVQLKTYATLTHHMLIQFDTCN